MAWCSLQTPLMKEKKLFPKLYQEFPGGALSALRFRCCPCCGLCSIPGPGNSAFLGCGQKQQPTPSQSLKNVPQFPISWFKLELINTTLMLASLCRIIFGNLPWAPLPSLPSPPLVLPPPLGPLNLVSFLSGHLCHLPHGAGHTRCSVEGRNFRFMKETNLEFRDLGFEGFGILKGVGGWKLPRAAGHVPGAVTGVWGRQGGAKSLLWRSF